VRLLDAVEVVEAWGHHNVKATHPTTFEITRESQITGRGDCIIAVRASRGAGQLCESFKAVAGREGARITATLQVAGLFETVEGWGDPRLSFTNPTSFVARKSDYACDRTLMIRADKAARDLSRQMILLLQDPGRKLVLTLRATLSEP